MYSYEDRASQMLLVVKNLPAYVGDVRDLGSIPGLRRSPGGGHGNSLQYSCLENPWTEEPGGLQSIGLQRVRCDRAHTVFSQTNLKLKLLFSTTSTDINIS